MEFDLEQSPVPVGKQRAQTLFSPWRFGVREHEHEENGLELSPSKIGLIYSHLSPTLDTKNGEPVGCP